MRKILIVGVLLLALVGAVFSTVFAHTYNGTVAITCTDFTAAGTGSDVLDRDNTGTGKESIRIDVLDGAGTVLYTLSFTNALGSYSGGLINPTPYTTAPQFNPISVVVTSLAGNDLPEVSQTLGTGNCAGLPTFGNTCLPLTSDTVVGDMPFATQADWAPGKSAPGVVINPGTYWVLGADSSGKYYKILLSCQYLWVPVESMQPSFQAPQNGAALPTTNVED
ncbi:MAG: hypothetical protein ABI700_15100 [Chloroflexota bacterium]